MSTDWLAAMPHMVHDLRALIRTSNLKMQLLARELGEYPSRRIAELLEGAEQAQKTLDELVRRVGLLADLDARGAGRNLAPLKTVILAAKLRVRDELDTAEATLELGELPEAGIPDRLELAWYELLRNSVLFRSADRPLQISVNGKLVGNALVIEFIDNGIGWDPEFSEKIFLPFEVLATPDRGPKRRGGLGLPIARTLIESAGGKIAGEPRTQGACFRVELPIDFASE